MNTFMAVGSVVTCATFFFFAVFTVVDKFQTMKKRLQHLEFELRHAEKKVAQLEAALSGPTPTGGPIQYTTDPDDEEPEPAWLTVLEGHGPRDLQKADVQTITQVADALGLT